MAAYLYLNTVKLLLRPSYSQSPVGLGDTKETPFCNVTEDTSISDPRKGLCFLPSLVFVGGRHVFHCFMNKQTVKDCVVAHCYGIHHTGSWFSSEVIFS